MPRDLDAFGPDVVVEAALFDAHALAAVTDLAVETDDALAMMRAALDRYEQGYAAQPPPPRPASRTTTPTSTWTGSSGRSGASRATSSSGPGTGPKPLGAIVIGRSSAGSTSHPASSARGSPNSRCRCSMTASTMSPTT